MTVQWDRECDKSAGAGYDCTMDEIRWDASTSEAEQQQTRARKKERKNHWKIGRLDDNMLGLEMR